ncbi:hypothetical protein [Senegalimassilia anaerobia]
MTANSNIVPKLGFGCMRFPLTDPKDVTAIDIDQVKEIRPVHGCRRHVFRYRFRLP